MLVVGRPLMPHQENKAHFSLWCLLNSPLIAGNDVRDMPEKVRLILTNKEIIALNQDTLAKQGYRYIYEADQREVWVKPLAGGDWGVILFNTSKEMIEKYTFDFAELKFLDGKTYKVRDLWAAADIGDTTKPFEGTLNWHDVAVLRLSPA
jgi:alpha-galactosidase